MLNYSSAISVALAAIDFAILICEMIHITKGTNVNLGIRWELFKESEFRKKYQEVYNIMLLFFAAKIFRISVFSNLMEKIFHGNNSVNSERNNGILKAVMLWSSSNSLKICGQLLEGKYVNIEKNKMACQWFFNNIHNSQFIYCKKQKKPNLLLLWMDLGQCKEDLGMTWLPL